MPELQYPPYVLLLLVSAAVNLSLSTYGFSNRQSKAHLYMAVCLLFAGMWPLLYALELFVADEALLLRIYHYRAAPIQVFSLFMLILVYNIVKRKMPPKWLLCTASFFAGICVLTVLTDPLLHFAWSTVEIITTADGFVTVSVVNSIWLKFTLVFYHGGTMLINLILLSKGMVTQKYPYKRQYILIFSALAAGVLITPTYKFGLIYYGGYDPIPAVLVFTSSLLAVAIFRYQMLSLAPYAKESVFEIIATPVIISDSRNRLTDYNDSAQIFFRLDHSMIGHPVNNVLKRINLTWDRLKESESIVTDALKSDGSSCKLSVLRKNVEYEGTKGSVIIFTDITAQVDSIKTAHEKEIVTYKESILGDMHDGIGGVVATAAIVAQSALKDTDPEEKNRKIEQIAKLLENGSFELRSMLNILDKDRIDWGSLVADLRGYSSNVLSAKGMERTFEVYGHPYTFPIDFDKYLSIFRLLKEILTNILKHSEADHVEIILFFKKDCFRMTVSDNGTGLEESRTGGYGLRNMSKRTEKLGGSLEISSESGTSIYITIPV